MHCGFAVERGISLEISALRIHSLRTFPLGSWSGSPEFLAFDWSKSGAT